MAVMASSMPKYKRLIRQSISIANELSLRAVKVVMRQIRRIHHWPPNTSVSKLEFIGFHAVFS
jgi:hypothetical protein